MGRRFPRLAEFRPEWWLERRVRRRAIAAVDARTPVVHVTHAGCLDGVGCDVLHRMHFHNELTSVFVEVRHVPVALTTLSQIPGRGRLLSISDLSWPMDHNEATLTALRDLKRHGWRVVWRDHHHKQWEGVDLEALRGLLDGFDLDQEQKECGTSLVQAALEPRDPFARALARVVRDRDLWINEDPRSRRLELAVAHLGDARTAHFLSQSKSLGDRRVQRAADLEEAQRKTRVEQAIEEARLREAEGLRVAIVYGDIPKNEGLHSVREQLHTDVEVNLKPNATLSVRTRRGCNIAHLVGQAFGGGGHPNAAGGRLALSPVELLSYWWSRGQNVEGRILRAVVQAQAPRSAGAAAPAAADVAGQAVGP